jgi:hypothetical protein
MVCRQRDCCRRNSCCWHFKSNNEPCCLRNLSIEQREVFDALYTKVAAVYRHALNWHVLDFASPFTAERALEDAAVEIVGFSLPAEQRPRFKNWRKKRERFKAANPVARSVPRLAAKSEREEMG